MPTVELAFSRVMTPRSRSWVNISNAHAVYLENRKYLPKRAMVKKTRPLYAPIPDHHDKKTASGKKDSTAPNIIARDLPSLLNNPHLTTISITSATATATARHQQETSPITCPTRYARTGAQRALRLGLNGSSLPPSLLHVQYHT